MKRQSMKQSGNPVSVISRGLGFKGKTADIVDWVVFGVILFIVGGILLGGS